jgi:hypothetical protein
LCYTYRAYARCDEGCEAEFGNQVHKKMNCDGDKMVMEKLLECSDAGVGFYITISIFTI